MPSQHTTLDPQPQAGSPAEETADPLRLNNLESKDEWKSDESDRASPGGSAGSGSAQPTAPATPTPPTVTAPTPEPTESEAEPAPESTVTAGAGEGDKTKQTETDGDGDVPLTMTTYMVVPPDGGWGWVVVAASFMCNLIVDGIISTFGIMSQSLMTEFKVAEAEVALVGALAAGFYLMAGPFVSALANRYGFRLVSILGAVIGCVGFALSSLATSIPFLYVTYGLVGGVGFGMVYVPAVITTGFYFERWRAMATGIAVCGSGIGIFTMAPLLEALISQYGWKVTLLFQAGLVLSCAVFGALFRPLKPSKVEVPYDPVKAAEMEKEKSEQAEGEKDGPEKLPLLMRIKMARDEMRAESIGSLHHHHDTVHSVANNNTNYPTAAQVLGLESKALKASCLSLDVSVSPSSKENNKNSSNVNHHNHLNGNLSHSEKRLSTPIKEFAGSPPSSPKPHADRRGSGPHPHRRARTASESSAKRGPGARPLYRDDIFFGASLQRLPEYGSKVSALDYTLSVTRLPTRADLAEEEEKTCRICPEAVKRTLYTMLDMSLLKSPTFLLLAASGFFTMMGFYVPFTYLKDRALNEGHWTNSTAVLLVSSIGVTNTIARVACGVLSSMPGVNVLLINNVALTLGGLGTMISGLSLSMWFQFSYTTVFGIAIACFASLRSILIVELLGLEKLTNAFGLLLLFQGIAACMGTPIAGAFKDATGGYDYTFYLAGFLILISAVICYPLNRINAWEKSRNSHDPDIKAAKLV